MQRRQESYAWMRGHSGRLPIESEPLPRAAACIEWKRVIVCGVWA
jgi:hypothetical protein